MEKIGRFEVDEVLFINDIGLNHGALAELQDAGFAAHFRVFPQIAKYPAVVIPAEGVSLKQLYAALKAALSGRPLPALPGKTVS